MTYSELIKKGTEVLAYADIAESGIDAWHLFEHITGMDRAKYYLHTDDAVSDSICRDYMAAIQRRAAHMPLQYITGHQEFMGLDIRVNESVLIPRQDTECLVESALGYVKDKAVLDMCTGSGCIALALKSLGHTHICHGTDISEAALDVARENAKLLNIGAEFFWSDMFDNVSRRYDVIVSNPPYIKTADIAGLQPEVAAHEPMGALDGGDDGLLFYRMLAIEGRKYLTDKGMVFFETGYDQTEAVGSILAEAGFTDINIKKDYAGNPRVVYASLDR